MSAGPLASARHGTDTGSSSMKGKLAASGVKRLSQMNWKAAVELLTPTESSMLPSSSTRLTSPVGCHGPATSWTGQAAVGRGQSRCAARHSSDAVLAKGTEPLSTSARLNVVAPPPMFWTVTCTVVLLPAGIVTSMLAGV